MESKLYGGPHMGPTVMYVPCCHHPGGQWKPTMMYVFQPHRPYQDGGTPLMFVLYPHRPHLDGGTHYDACATSKLSTHFESSFYDMRLKMRQIYSSSGPHLSIYMWLISSYLWSSIEAHLGMWLRPMRLGPLTYIRPMRLGPFDIYKAHEIKPI